MLRQVPCPTIAPSAAPATLPARARALKSALSSACRHAAAAAARRRLGVALLPSGSLQLGPVQQLAGAGGDDLRGMAGARRRGAALPRLRLHSRDLAEVVYAANEKMHHWVRTAGDVRRVCSLANRLAGVQGFPGQGRTMDGSAVWGAERVLPVIHQHITLLLHRTHKRAPCRIELHRHTVIVSR